MSAEEALAQFGKRPGQNEDIEVRQPDARVIELAHDGGTLGIEVHQDIDAAIEMTKDFAPERAVTAAIDAGPFDKFAGFHPALKLLL
jgi:hypothetical protein